MIVTPNQPLSPNSFFLCLRAAPSAISVLRKTPSKSATVPLATNHSPLPTTSSRIRIYKKKGEGGAATRRTESFSGFDFQLSTFNGLPAARRMKNLQTGRRDKRKARSRSKNFLALAMSRAICARSSSGLLNFFSSRRRFQKWTSMRPGEASPRGART
jgi:hypothetical protein